MKKSYKLTGRLLHQIIDSEMAMAFTWEHLSKKSKTQYNLIAKKIRQYLAGQLTKKELNHQIEKSDNERARIYGVNKDVS